MSKTDAERAMDIYRNFTKQTDFVVSYLGVARQHQHHTRVEVPKLKHAPVNLGRQLEDYLRDPDFEVHRRQYLAELDAKKSRGGASVIPKFKTNANSKPTSSMATSAATNGSRSAATPQVTRGPDPDLIDFFDSIEQNQTPMAVQPVQQMQTGMTPWGAVTTAPFQQNGFIAQPTGFQATNPFQQQQQQLAQQQAMQPAFTGAGFGGFSPQSAFQPGSLAPIPQDSAASFPAGGGPMSLPGLQTGGAQQMLPQNTNPFRQSTMMASPPGMQPGIPGLVGSISAPTSPPEAGTPQSTNPFARSSPQSALPLGAANSPFHSQPPAPPAAAPLQPMATGTNPFAKNFAGAQQPERPVTSGGLVPQPTGSTNPFRQGAFVNHNTGMGWQHNQQRMGGGLDQLDTIAVFPRPAQQTPWSS